jgi:hypothetical protein
MKPREVYVSKVVRFSDGKNETYLDHIILKKYLKDDLWLVEWWIWDSKWVGKSPGNGHGIFKDYEDQRDMKLTGAEILKNYKLVPNFKLSNPMVLD